MADKNIQIKQRNATNDGWDNLYPKTKAELVEASTGTLEDHVQSTEVHITNTERDTWNGKQDALGFTPEDSANKGVANGYASLGVDGKIPTSQVPAIAITDTFSAESEAEQLGLSVQKGDVVVRTDLNKSYINQTGNNNDMSDWQEMLTPTDSVLSVNGKTGAVNLTTSDITEGSNKYYTEERVDANTNVSANTDHRNSPHAPSDAQKNSDITKAEIEAKLTGTITSHEHPVNAPQEHASSHITGGSDVIPDAEADGDSGLMSGSDKSKLDGVEANANNYTHPASHAASIIVQDSSRRFVSDTEKAEWNGKQKEITVSSTAPASPEAGELFYEII